MFLSIETVKEVATLMENGNELGAKNVIDTAMDDFFDRSGNNESDEDDIPLNTVVPPQAPEIKQVKKPDDDVEIDDL
jgi:hypothetical protein